MDNDRRHTVVDSPVGPLTLVGDRDDALTGLYLPNQRHAPAEGSFGARDDDVLAGLREQLTAYFEGELTDFDVPLAPHGTPFQLLVWEALRTIPYGGTRSYGELAAQIGRAGASRAVGLANGRNPIAIVVPCHRVIGANGSLTGYGGGLPTKRALLDLERRRAAAASKEPALFP